MKKRKKAVVSFKADAGLVKKLGGIENRSEFIRSAVEKALGEKCPLCEGTGMLTPAARRKWSRLSRKKA